MVLLILLISIHRTYLMNITEDVLFLINSKLRGVHSALINSEPWLDSRGRPTGSWKGRSVLQRADGVEEAEGSTTCRQPHTHRHAPGTLSHARRPLCTHTTTPSYPFHPLTDNEGISGDALHQSTTRGSGHMTAGSRETGRGLGFTRCIDLQIT